VALLNGRGGVSKALSPSGTLVLSPLDTDVAAIAVQHDGPIVVAGTTKDASGGYSGVMYRLAGERPSPGRNSPPVGTKHLA
jgi:hypothetical protein